MMYLEEIRIGMLVRGTHPDPTGETNGFVFVGRVTWKYPEAGLVNVDINDAAGLIYARPEWLEPVL